MKKITSFAVALAALSLMSCQKDVANNVDPAQAGEKAVVSLSLYNPVTRATVADTEDEAKVSSIQIFVFNGDDVDGYKNAEESEISALKVTLEATAGLRDIYAFVNAPDLSSYTSKAALLAAVSNLSDNALDKFVMSGKLESQNVTASFEATINVDRYAARVRISKITRNFTNVALRSVDFKIVRMYLSSAVTNELYNYGAPASYNWLNASFGATRTISTDNVFVYNKLADAAAVANGSSYETEHSLYCYANTNASDDENSPQTFRQTRLVIECQIDADGNGTLDADEYFTYPIALGAIESNKSYEIKELVLTILGNHSNGDDTIDDGEDNDIEKSELNVTIEVNDWTEVLVGEAGTVTI